MDRQRASSSFHQAQAALEKATSTLAYQPRMQGQPNQTTGMARQAMGGVKDAIRDARNTQR